MQTVLNMVGEFVAHEWRILALIPILALLAYAWAVLLTPRRLLQWATRLWPTSARLHLELGTLLADEEPRAAEAELKRALSLKPDLPGAYYFLTHAQLEQQDRLEDAEQTVREMLRQYPGDAVGYCLQGRVRERRERYAEAEKSYRMANAAAPEMGWPCALLGALLRDKLDNRLGAEIAYRQAIRNEPGNARHYFHLGNLLVHTGRFDEAANCFQDAAHKNRRDAASQINLGLALVAAGRTPEARRALPRAIRMRPKSATAEFGLGRLLRRLDEPALAEAAFRRAIDKDPSLMEAYAELIQLLDRTDAGLSEAERVCRLGLEVDPENAFLKYDLSLLLRRMERESEALPVLQQLVAADAEDFESVLGLAAIHKLRGESGAFLQYAERARRLIRAEDSYSFACLEGVCDNCDLAFEHLRRAVRLSGFNHWWAWHDPDLQFIRDDPRFAEIVGPPPETE